MATLDELLKDLTRGDGRKFRKWGWPLEHYFEPIFKAHSAGETYWYGVKQDGEFYEDYAYSGDWAEWVTEKNESHRTKRVKLYRPIFKKKNQETYRMGLWTSEKIVGRTQLYAIGVNGGFWWENVGWEEKEVTVCNSSRPT